MQRRMLINATSEAHALRKRAPSVAMAVVTPDIIVCTAKLGTGLALVAATADARRQTGEAEAAGAKVDKGTRAELKPLATARSVVARRNRWLPRIECESANGN